MYAFYFIMYVDALHYHRINCVIQRTSISIASVCFISFTWRSKTNCAASNAWTINIIYYIEYQKQKYQRQIYRTYI